MPADPSPPSLLISPDRRRRLQQQYEEARRLSAQNPPDIRRIHELLAGCVAADLGNILYVNALLANLKRRDEARSPRRGLWAIVRQWLGAKRARRPGASSPSDKLAEAGQLLWQRFSDPSIYLDLAAAAGERDFEEVELRYLTAARELAPDDATALRLLARALTRQGRFEDAIGPWFAVLALEPGDTEAELAVEDLRDVGERGIEPAASSDARALVEQGQASQAAGQLEQAERLFSQAQSALGGDLALLEIRENLRLQQSQNRVETARRRAVHDAHRRAQQLVARLQDEHNRLEIEIFNLRAERLPGDWRVRLLLAQRLKAAGNFSGAVERLNEARRLAADEAGVVIELGECWQHLRQFAKALAYYEEAATLAARRGPGEGDEARVMAHYRAGVLAAAMGRPDAARKHLAEVVALAPGFRDASTRLSALSR